MTARARLRKHLSVSVMIPMLVVGVSSSASAQDANEEAAAEYARVLKQISDTKINIARQEMLLDGQKARIAELEAQVASSPGLAEAYPPVLAKFAAGISDVVGSDIPFRSGERQIRVADFQDDLKNAEMSLGTKIARALQIANIEATYGYEVEAYDADHPSDPRRRFKACEADLESKGCAITKDLREKLDNGASLPQLDAEFLDGSFVRYGRLSMAYVDYGTSDVLVYDTNSREWRDARGSEEAGIRRNLRIARGEAAPDVVEAPVVITN